LRVEAAEIAYRDTRDRLAEDMIVGSAETNTCLPISTAEERTQTLAGVPVAYLAGLP
jgi:hypothetical protein